MYYTGGPLYLLVFVFAAFRNLVVAPLFMALAKRKAKPLPYRLMALAKRKAKPLPYRLMALAK
ncbi:MAG: hypothetical protein Q8L26_05690, partial [Candidatus Omnitrophota bacterium]|nr:hypothetical protein [Candidatus Omnitrophota bacterium]